MNKKLLYVLPFFLLARLSAASAAPDFYGVIMKSESYAKGVAIQNPDDAIRSFAGREGLDKKIHAYGYFESFFGLDPRIRIRVFNDSAKPVRAPYLYADYTAVTRDGTRWKLRPPVMAWFPATERIDPGRSAVFKPSLAGLSVKREDVQMIICSFNMDETKVVLLPVPKKTARKK